MAGEPKLDALIPTNASIVSDEVEDIYRGLLPHDLATTQSPAVRAPSLYSASSTSSSSSFGWRRGPIAQAIEQALARWARRHSSSSSTTSSGSSSTGSLYNIQRHGERNNFTQSSRRNKIQHNLPTRDLKTRDCVPREFSLLLPRFLSPIFESSASDTDQTQEQRLLRSTNLDLVLSQLEAAFKRRSKLKRTEKRAQAVHKGGGDHKASSSIEGKCFTAPTESTSQDHANFKMLPKTGQAWWLDVSSPLWEDMQKIGKLLHLHPLTLEDIFYQESREKLELFSALGYYFIVFRALADSNSKDPYELTQSNPFVSEKLTNNDLMKEGARDDHMNIQAVNVYLVIFRDGIISFHFGDIATHLHRVRERIFMLESTVGAQLSSDWIAHGVMDSIVDSFFPVLNQIDDEVKVLDGLGHGLGDAGRSNLFGGKESVIEQIAQGQDPSEPETKHLSSIEKMSHSPIVSHQSLKIFVTRKGKTFSAQNNSPNQHGDSKGPEGTTISNSVDPLRALIRISSTRRLVTSLARILGPKSGVIAQIQKHLISPSGRGARRLLAYDNEISIYIGDVYDHILSLQQSLDHYERVLSHSHPAYLNFVHTELAKARAGADQALYVLTVVTVATSICVAITSLFSMNVRIPTNLVISPDGNVVPTKTFIVFGLVLTGCFLAALIFAGLLKYWWVKGGKVSPSKKDKRQ